jgi:hypothetical protein
MSALTYYVWSTGADTNSGSSEGTGPIANGTAATRSTNVYTLDGSPDLSGVTANQDTIHIVGETSGRGNDGTIFEITAVDDGADTVTVSPTPTGGTSGLTWAIGGSFATINKGMSVVDAGDKCYVKATASYAEEIIVDTVGTSTSNVLFEGYSSTVGDDGKVTIEGTGLNSCMSSSLTGIYYIFNNFIFQNATNRGVTFVTEDYVRFYNCEFLNNGYTGVIVDTTGNFINCVFTGNAFGGAYCDGGKFLGCIFGNNTEPHIDGNSGISLLYKCVFYEGKASTFTVGNNNITTIGCTFDGENTASQIYQSAVTTQTVVFVDNICYDYTTALATNASSYPYNQFLINNLMFSNGTDYSNTFWDCGRNDVTTAPAFTDEANNDYTLGATSPAIDAGITPGGVT